LPFRADSIPAPTADSLASDTTGLARDTIPGKGSDIETTINYTATDSIRASMDNKTVWLYGDAKITYGQIELEAERIVIDYENSAVTALGGRDSTGAWIGYPLFKDGEMEYETKGIVYNFKTGRARINDVITQQGEGFLHARRAFKNDKNEIFSVRNSYTTCNLEHPHFEIQSTRTKAIPKDKIVSGPFYLEFNDIPLPIGFLFGMFPAQRESKSGILFPSYGEEGIRGFSLRRGGYFFDISEYMKLALRGDIYSKGGHALYADANYAKRYAYQGSFNFSYSKNTNTRFIERPEVVNDFRLMWSHTPQSKGTGRFSASVNAATATFTRNNNLMFGNPGELMTPGLNQISTKLSSNVSYSKKLVGTPFTIGVNLSHNQDLVSKVVDLPLPNLNVNMTNLYPFQRKGKTGVLDNFMIGYSMTGTNRITNNIGRVGTSLRDSIAPFNLDNLGFFFKNARKGVRHNVPIQYSFKALKHFTVTPSVSYEEKWYFEKLNWNYNSTTRQFTADTTFQFNRVANYSFTVGTNTRIFGMYLFKDKEKKIKAIRHTIIPDIGFSYTPDFTRNTNYFQKIDTTRSAATTSFVYKARHEGFVYGASQPGGSGSINFGIGNNIEAKVKAPKDSVERKVMLLNNLSIRSGYDLFAESFKLAPITIAANTSVFNDLVNVNFGATLDPYNYVSTIDENGKRIERRVDSYSWKGRSLGRITNANLALNMNLNPQMREKNEQSREKIANSDLAPQDKEYLLQNPNAYIDFDIPWSLNLAYTINYTRPLSAEAQIIQSLQMNGDLSISEKWKIVYATGYDFERSEFTQTNLGITRDLHCWTFNFNWVPFGRFQSYNLTIAVKASMLQDLKIERRKPFFDNL